MNGFIEKITNIMNFNLYSLIPDSVARFIVRLADAGQRDIFTGEVHSFKADNFSGEYCDDEFSHSDTGIDVYAGGDEYASDIQSGNVYPEINSASGLSMMGCTDVAGNFYGESDL